MKLWSYQRYGYGGLGNRAASSWETWLTSSNFALDNSNAWNTGVLLSPAEFWSNSRARIRSIRSFYVGIEVLMMMTVASYYFSWVKSRLGLRGNGEGSLKVIWTEECVQDLCHQRIYFSGLSQTPGWELDLKNSTISEGEEVWPII